jgi:hypothetical protein
MTFCLLTEVNGIGSFNRIMKRIVAIDGGEIGRIDLIVNVRSNEVDQR